ncbi:MAG: RHS repeat-associated core domain-containing protein [Holophagales bacterium]|nr:MAG: RHS repeat-associated core domain-containing protein [Holophagales bacterium]
MQQRNPLDTDLLVDSFETGDTSKWNRTQHWETSTLLGYVFDEHGNLLTEKRNGATFRTHATNGATNRLTSGTYDAAGNRTLYDNVTTTFDALNRVVKRQASGGTPLYFLYTADDERTITWDSESAHPVWLRFTLRDFDGKLIRKVDETSSSTLVADEDVIFRGDQPLGRETFDVAPTSFHLSLDHLGSVRMTTSGSGAVVAKKKYYPFGEEATPFFEQAAIALKYTGHERDAYDPAATGDDRDYMHARYFLPLTGRLLSADLLLGNTRVPQSLNRFAYVKGNPLRYVDRFGLAAGAVITVTGEDPCPGTPASYSCRDWESLMDAMERLKAAAAAFPSEGVGPLRSAYQLRFEEMAVEGNYLAAAVDFIGLEFFIPESNGDLGFDLGATLLPFGRVGKGLTKSFAYAVKKLGLDAKKASAVLHAVKRAAGRGGNADVVFDTVTGDIISPQTGEVLGNLADDL